MLNDAFALHGLSTNSHYALLQDRNDEIPPPNPLFKRQHIKPPPIVTTQLSWLDIAAVMHKCAIPAHKYRMQNWPTATKIFLTTIEHFKIVSAALIANNVPHYTHDLRADKTDKFVLNGLPEMWPADIQFELCQRHIDCRNVKRIKPRRPNNSSVSYVVYTTPNSVDLDQLRAAVRSIRNVSVSWEMGRIGHRFPTQCDNCQLYGHGERNCYLAPRCAECGQPHRKRQCPGANDWAFRPRCCLCSGPHSATSLECPKRQEYVRVRIASGSDRLVQQRQRQPGNPGPPTEYAHTPDKYPNWAAPPEPPSGAPVFPVECSAPIADSPTTYAHQLSANSYAQSGGLGDPYCAGNQMDLFTMDELMALSTELMEGLQRSTTRMQQWHVINKIAIKFACHQV